MTSKEELRLSFQKLRKNLSLKIRKCAKTHALHFLKARLASFQRILSFFPTPNEIDLSSLNEWLCKEKKLFLPKTASQNLLIFQITDLSIELENHPLFALKEPKSTLCKQVSENEIDCVLVPALAFDEERYRLGYGGGYYDRLLGRTNIYSIGIGFKEQMSSSLLPREPHDQRLSELALF
jgi:5-formyltetrahydrofolate cyclo-ligase